MLVPTPPPSTTQLPDATVAVPDTRRLEQTRTGCVQVVAHSVVQPSRVQIAKCHQILGHLTSCQKHEQGDATRQLLAAKRHLDSSSRLP